MANSSLSFLRCDLDIEKRREARGGWPKDRNRDGRMLDIDKLLSRNYKNDKQRRV